MSHGGGEKKKKTTPRFFDQSNYESKQYSNTRKPLPNTPISNHLRPPTHPSLDYQSQHNPGQNARLTHLQYPPQRHAQ